MNHVVHYSGGLASFAEGLLTAQKYGVENVTLLFADTRTEDEDLYRFLHEGAKIIGAKLEIVEDGRNIWEVFESEKLLGNSRIAPCSRILKREVLDAHVDQNHSNAVHHFGFYWDEGHRLERLKLRKEHVESLLFESRMEHDDIKQICFERGIEIPRLYKMGLQHNNCGGMR